MGQVTGTTAETAGAAATAGFQGWSPDADHLSYTLRNGGDGTAATVYAGSTAYAVGKSVTFGGATYVAHTAVLGSNVTNPDVNANFQVVDNHRGPSEVLSATAPIAQLYR